MAQELGTADLVGRGQGSAPYPTKHSTVPTTKNDLVQNANSSKNEKPCLAPAQPSLTLLPQSPPFLYETERSSLSTSGPNVYSSSYHCLPLRVFPNLLEGKEFVFFSPYATGTKYIVRSQGLTCKEKRGSESAPSQKALLH